MHGEHAHAHAHAPLPQLRHRGVDEYVFDTYEAPTSIVGHVVALDEEYVRISQGPALETELHPLDFVRTFGDDEDLEAPYAIFADAAMHKDLVKIRLAASGITYENDAQIKRYAAMT